MSVLGTEEFLFISIQISYWVKQSVDKFPYLGIKWQHGEVNHLRLPSDQEENMWSVRGMLLEQHPSHRTHSLHRHTPDLQPTTTLGQNTTLL